MRQLFLISNFLIVLSLSANLFASPIKAQNFNFEKAYQDYLYNYNQYQQAHQKYEAARSAYLTYQTLTAKTEAASQTLKMLQRRDEVIRTDLIALKMKLAEIESFKSDQPAALTFKLSDEIDWYHQHLNQLTSAADLDDLLATSKEAEKKYQSSQVLAYQTLGIILISKESSLRERLKKEVEKIEEKIELIRQSGDKNTAVIERWLLEAKNKLIRSEEKESQAQQKLEKMAKSKSDSQKIYNEFRVLVYESHLYLKDTNTYLKELIKEIKRAD